MTEEMITITLKHYRELREDSDFLDALRAAGVDNWDGYGFAIDLMENGEE